MDAANRREALTEVRLDIKEGADIVIVKPAMSYLDILADLAVTSPVPVAAYQISGKYAMISKLQPQTAGSTAAERYSSRYWGSSAPVRT